MTDLPEIVGATISDFLTWLDFGASGIGGTLSAAAISMLLKSRLDQGRKIFIEEVRQAKRPIKDAHEKMS